MKNLLSAVIIAFVVTSSINICSAEYYSRSVTELNKMIGTWYDSKGNVALTIGSDKRKNPAVRYCYSTQRYIFMKTFIDKASGVFNVNLYAAVD